MLLVTGAAGHIGARLCALLRAAGREVLAVDLEPGNDPTVERCDLRADAHVARLFTSRPIREIIHLAAVLPTAFRADPVAAAAVNVGGTLSLLREASARRVRRFILGSSMSVYGSRDTARPLSEDDPAAPDDPYGAAKRLVEVVGEQLAAAQELDFVSLRIARVVGPGARNTASAWRSQLFEPKDGPDPPVISLPFTPTARLSLVHVEEVARMLMCLADADVPPRRVYNGPAEGWQTHELAELVQRTRAVRVQMGESPGGPLCDGGRFARDFGFRLRGLAEYLAT